MSRSQFGIQYRATVPPDARWSRVKILCKHHPDQVIAQWSTFDGGRHSSGSGKARGRSTSDTGRRTTCPEARTVRSRVLTPAVAAPKPGDVPHARISLRCERPSCTYQPQIREHLQRRLNDFVLALWANGLAEHVISDLDTELRPPKK